MSYLAALAKQPSTWRGIVMLLGAAGVLDATQPEGGLVVGIAHQPRHDEGTHARRHECLSEVGTIPRE